MDEIDRTAPPLPSPEASAPADGGSDRTVPGRRERIPAGRYAPGGLILGRYKVLAELGRGGMGVVFRCFDETAGIEAALKALPPELSHDTSEMEEVKANFQLVEKLHHPNIAAVRNLERDPATGDFFLIMECAGGEDLRAWLRRRRQEGSLTFDAVLSVVRQVAAALDYAHSEKIIHRDIKPGNVMIDAEGRVKVLDFGLAAQIHTSLTRVSMACRGTSGTAPYMAPEQWEGKVQGAAADQYALAAMTYEMLAGRPPFTAADPAVLQQLVLTREPEAPPNLPSFRWNALRRAMSRDPGDRFPDCAAFAAALESPERPMPGKLSRSALWGVAALGILAAVAVLHVREPGRVPAVPHVMQSAPVPDRPETADRPAAEVSPPPAKMVPAAPEAPSTPPPAAVPAAAVSSAVPERTVPAAEPAAKDPVPEFRLKCGSASGRLAFAEGEEVSLTVESNCPCYILVYVRQPDGSEVVLFPNRYNWNAKIPAGVPVAIPGTDKAGFKIVASPPFGTDEIHFVACTAEAEIFKKAMGLAQRETRHFATTRGLRVEAETQAAACGRDGGGIWANAALSITTKPR